MEILWTFSIYLEVVAILPQLYMLHRLHHDGVETDAPIWHYIFSLGLYRGIYILNWIYRYYYESMKHFYFSNRYLINFVYKHLHVFLGFYDNIAIVSGCIQTIIYCHFFYLYISKTLRQEKFGDVKYQLVDV